jgi:ABC-type multidrug transport system fused ATPase/permease subunit
MVAQVLADQRAAPFLILDEPAAALDADSAKELGNVLASLTYLTDDGVEHPTTVIVATHNLSLVDDFTHAAVMANGRVIESGARQELVNRKGHFYRYLTRNSGAYPHVPSRATAPWPLHARAALTTRLSD